jgi:putative addiction module component (TIGR02574 family)
MSTVTEIESALAKLPEDEQRQIAAWLDARLAPIQFDPDVETAWDETVKRRIDELDRGIVEAIPAEQVFAEVRRLLGR